MLENGSASFIPPKILVAEAEPELRRYLRACLTLQDARVLEASSHDEGMRQCALEQPDLMLLGTDLAGQSGLGTLRLLREWTSIPIVMLSDADDEELVVDALDSGANDFVAKPFRTTVLMARIRAAYRASQQQNHTSAEPVMQCGELSVDVPRHRCWLGDDEVTLTPKEFELLSLLIQHEGKVLTHRFILQQVWGPGHCEDVEYVRVFIKRLRDKIEREPAKPERIITEPGIGYRLADGRNVSRAA